MSAKTDREPFVIVMRGPEPCVGRAAFSWRASGGIYDPADDRLRDFLAWECGYLIDGHPLNRLSPEADACLRRSLYGPSGQPQPSGLRQASQPAARARAGTDGRKNRHR